MSSSYGVTKNKTYITVGGKILLTCQSSSLTMWNFREPLDNLTHRFHNSSTFLNLELGPMTHRYYGRYHCTGTNEIGHPFIDTVMVTVYGMFE